MVLPTGRFLVAPSIPRVECFVACLWILEKITPFREMEKRRTIRNYDDLLFSDGFPFVNTGKIAKR